MRTSFHHQPEAQHPIFQLSTSWQADYPIFRGQSEKLSLSTFDPQPDDSDQHPASLKRQDCTLVTWYRFFTHLAREGRMTVTIGRRELLAALGGAAAAWPFAARAQQQPVMPVIGFLNSAQQGPFRQFVDAFRRGLSETGFVEGQNVA